MREQGLPRRHDVPLYGAGTVFVAWLITSVPAPHRLFPASQSVATVPARAACRSCSTTPAPALLRMVPQGRRAGFRRHR